MTLSRAVFEPGSFLFARAPRPTYICLMPQYRIGQTVFPSLEKAGAAYKPGDRIVHKDGSSLTSAEVDRALAAWLRSKPLIRAVTSTNAAGKLELLNVKG